MKNVINKNQWFISQCPNFNFEMGADELINKAIERNILKKIDEDQYQIIDPKFMTE